MPCAPTDVYRFCGNGRDRSKADTATPCPYDGYNNLTFSGIPPAGLVTLPPNVVGHMDKELSKRPNVCPITKRNKWRIR